MINRTTRRYVGHAFVLATCLALTACSNSRGRLMGENEEDYVGSRAAGQAVWSRLVEGTVNKLLDTRVASNRGMERVRVAFLGVENKTSESLGDWRDQLFQTIDTAINQSKRFRNVSSRYVEAGMREARLKPEDLFLPKHQRSFAAALEQAGSPVEFLLFATLTTGTTRGDVRQVNYQLILELVDIATGDPEKVSVDLRKAYTK